MQGEEGRNKEGKEGTRKDGSKSQFTFLATPVSIGRWLSFVVLLPHGSRHHAGCTVRYVAIFASNFPLSPSGQQSQGTDGRKVGHPNPNLNSQPNLIRGRVYTTSDSGVGARPGVTGDRRWDGHGGGHASITPVRQLGQLAAVSSSTL